MKKLGEDPATRSRRDAALRPLRPLRAARRSRRGEKPKRSGLPKGLAPDDVDLDKALGLLSLPREVGKHPEDGEPIMAGIGRFGPYVQHGKTYANLETGDDVLNIGLNRAVTLIAEKKLKGPRGKSRFGADPGRSLGDHPDKGGAIVVKNGRYGPYVSHDGVNATLPSDKTPETITLEEAVALIDARAARGGGKKAGQAPQRAAAQGRRAQNTGENGQQAQAARCGSRQGKTRSQGQVGEVTGRRLERLPVSDKAPAGKPAGSYLFNDQRALTRGPLWRETLQHQDFASASHPVPRRTSCSPSSAKQPGKVGTREIARAFGLKNADRVELKRMLRELEDGGQIESAAQEAASRRHAAERRGRRHHQPRPRRRIDRRPDRMGRGGARPAAEDPHPLGAPRQARRGRRRRRPGARCGSRKAAMRTNWSATAGGSSRSSTAPSSACSASSARCRMAAAGFHRSTRSRSAVNTRSRPAPAAMPQDGDLVAVEVAQRRRGVGLPVRACHRAARLARQRARGQPDRDPRAPIPHVFPPAVLREAEAAQPARLAGREDWRDVPLVTIDPADAKDHDDAVHAEPDSDPKNRGGHIIRVAIADVADYVRPGSALDREALIARQFGLFSRPRRADAAGAHFQRSLFAAAEGRPRRARGADGGRCRWPQALAYVSSRADALGGKAQLPAGAGGDRRLADDTTGPLLATVLEAALRRLRTRSNARATSAVRSTSICPSARSSSTARRYGRPCRDAGAPRRASADRGIHDPRQCRGGRDAGEARACR